MLSPRATGLYFLLGPTQSNKRSFTYFPSCRSPEVQNNGLEQRAQSQIHSFQLSNCSFLLLIAMRLLASLVHPGDVSQGQGTRFFYFRVPVCGTQGLEEARACSDLQNL